MVAQVALLNKYLSDLENSFAVACWLCHMINSCCLPACFLIIVLSKYLTFCGVSLNKNVSKSHWAILIGGWIWCLFYLKKKWIKFHERTKNASNSVSNISWVKLFLLSFFWLAVKYFSVVVMVVNDCRSDVLARSWVSTKHYKKCFMIALKRV